MKKRRRAKKRLKVIIAVAGLLVILCILLFAPFFNISDIEIKGNIKYTNQEIIEKSGLILGENGFRRLKMTPQSLLELRIVESEDKIRQLPYVKDCTVKLVFPDKVSIEITEREPRAFIRYLDNYLYVDKEGYVLETSNDELPINLKEIRGIEFLKYTIGEQLEDSELIKTGVEVIEAINSSDQNSGFKLYDVVDWIDMIAEDNLLLSLDNRIIVRFNPLDQLQYTIDYTKEIFFKKINSHETGRLEFLKGQYPSFIPE
jgi:cell division protein FtsQ